MSLSSYRPGAWFGVFGSAVTLLLPESEKARVAALWELVDDDAGVEEVLDALLRAGLAALPGFVLVGRGDVDGEPTMILARGDVRLTGTADGEDVEIDGTSARTWVERSLERVESLAIEVGGTDDHAGEEGVDEGGRVGDDLSIIGGLVRVSRVDQPAAASARSRGAAAVEATGAAEVVEVVEAADQVVEPGPLDRPIDLPGSGWATPPPPPSSHPSAPPGAHPSAPPVGMPVGPPPAPSFADDPLSAPLPSLPDQVPDQVPDEAPETVPDQPVDEPTDEPVDEPVDKSVDHDGLTRSGVDRSELFRELPGIPGQPAAPHVVASVATLRFSTGEVIDVDRVVLIGRAPEARRLTSTEQPRLVKVHSPLYEISSTHVEVRPGSGADHGTAVVTDMGSTNGTVLDQPGVGAESLRAGVAVQLIPGAIINLGDGVSIQVTRP